MYGLVALVILVLAAAVAAYGKTSVVVPNVGATPGFNAGGVNETAQSAQEAVPEKAEHHQKTMVPARRVLAVIDGESAYRALTGSCPDTPAVIEVTVDGGIHWAAADLSEVAPASSAQRIVAGLGGYAAAIALDPEDCAQPAALVTFDGGTGWQSSKEALEETWHVDPANAAVLHDPSGDTVDAPCSVSRLAPGGADTLGLVCEDTRLFASADGGQTWTGSVELPGIDSLGGYADGFWAASVGAPECEGVQLSKLDVSLATKEQVCVPDVAPEPGNTAIAAEGDSVWLWAGDAIFRSSDAGENWAQ